MATSPEEKKGEDTTSLEYYMKIWAEDSRIDETNLAFEALLIPTLHHKYYKLYIDQVMIMHTLETRVKKLRLDKSIFFQHGPSSFKDAKDNGWKLPPGGKVLKTDVEKFIDADQEVIELTLKAALAKEKAEFLDSIIKTLTYNRGHDIRTALEVRKFEAAAR